MYWACFNLLNIKNIKSNVLDREKGLSNLLKYSSFFKNNFSYMHNVYLPITGINIIYFTSILLYSLEASRLSSLQNSRKLVHFIKLMPNYFPYFFFKYLFLNSWRCSVYVSVADPDPVGSCLFGSPGSGSGSRSGKIPDPDPLSTKRPMQF